MKDLGALPEGTVYLNNDRICIPTSGLDRETVNEMINILRDLSSRSVSLGPLGTNEHYLRIYKGEQSYETN